MEERDRQGYAKNKALKQDALDWEAEAAWPEE